MYNQVLTASAGKKLGNSNPWKKEFKELLKEERKEKK